MRIQKNVLARAASGLLTCMLLFVVGSGCALSSKAKGAIIGGGAGAAAGAVVGKQTGSTVRGAIIGAAVGGAAGMVIGSQMDKQAEELAYDLPGATVQRIGEGIAITFPDGLLFTFDSDALISSARTNLDAFAASLAKYPNTRTMVVGHTDSVGTDSYNQALSERRAKSAADFIVRSTVMRSRVTTLGAGEAEPIATNDTDEGRSLNRRVEIAIYSSTAGG